MTNRSYTSNAKNVIFTSFGVSAPYIEEVPGGSSTYQVTLSSAQGEWSTTDNEYTAASSITFTGDKNQVNAWFQTVTWYPPKNVTSNVSVTYTQNKDGVLQITKNFLFEHAANGTIPTNYYVINTAGSNTWLPTLVEQKYSQLMDYIVIAGGGGGANTNPGGGGGGGQHRTLTNQSISLTSYAAVVGAGGAKGGGSNSDGAVGSNSSFNGLVSAGGLGGISSALSRNANGGDSGSGNDGGIGFTDIGSNDSGGGGGGQGGFGGGTGDGQNASGNTGGAGGAGIAGPTGFPGFSAGDELCRGGGGSNSTSIGTFLTTAGSGGPGGSQSGSGGQTGAVLIKTHP